MADNVQSASGHVAATKPLAPFETALTMANATRGFVGFVAHPPVQVVLVSHVQDSRGRARGRPSPATRW